MEENEYADFIVADNDEETATPQDTDIDSDTPNVEETSTEATAEPTETVETTEKTETQRVSQRINESRQKGIDEHIAKQGYVWNDKPVTTEAQYDQAMKEQKEQQDDQTEREKYQETNLPEDVVNELMEGKKDRAERKAEKEAKTKEDLKQKGFSDFFNKFPDVKNESITQETWEDYNKGSSLVDAYTRQENAELKAKLKVYEQNKTNKSKAPINNGISTHGSDEVASEDDFMRGFNSI